MLNKRMILADNFGFYIVRNSEMIWINIRWCVSSSVCNYLKNFDIFRQDGCIQTFWINLGTRDAIIRNNFSRWNLHLGDFPAMSGRNEAAWGRNHWIHCRSESTHIVRVKTTTEHHHVFPPKDDYISYTIALIYFIRGAKTIQYSMFFHVFSPQKHGQPLVRSGSLPHLWPRSWQIGARTKVTLARRTRRRHGEDVLGVGRLRSFLTSWAWDDWEVFWKGVEKDASFNVNM